MRKILIPLCAVFIAGCSSDYSVTQTSTESQSTVAETEPSVTTTVPVLYYELEETSDTEYEFRMPREYLEFEGQRYYKNSHAFGEGADSQYYDATAHMREELEGVGLYAESYEELYELVGELELVAVTETEGGAVYRLTDNALLVERPDEENEGFTEYLVCHAQD